MDSRKERTKYKIISSYINLLKQSDVSSITVTKLCNEAHINRSTFYENFGHIDNLIRRVLIHEIEEICIGSSVEMPSEHTHMTKISIAQVETYIENLLENHILMKLTRSGDPWIIHMFIEEQAKYTMQLMEKNDMIRYRAYFQNIAAVSTIIEWNNNGMPISIHELSKIISDFSPAMYM